MAGSHLFGSMVMLNVSSDDDDAGVPATNADLKSKESDSSITKSNGFFILVNDIGDNFEYDGRRKAATVCGSLHSSTLGAYRKRHHERLQSSEDGTVRQSHTLRYRVLARDYRSA